VNNRKGFSDSDFLLYYRGNTLGTNWNSNEIREYVGILDVQAAIVRNNQVKIYFTNCTSLNQSTSYRVALSSQIPDRGPDGKFSDAELIIAFDYDILTPLNKFSVNVIDGAIAFCYYLGKTDVSYSNSLIYQLEFGRPVVIKTYDPNDFSFSINHLTLSYINNAPCIVALEQGETGSGYIYFRGGDPLTFVEDTDITANYSIN